MHPTLSVCSRWSQTAPPKLLAFIRYVSVIAKKLPLRGSCRRRRLRGFGREKTVWKTAIFPAFSTQKNSSGPVLKTWGPAIPDWRKINRRSGTVCRMQRKSFDFLFYKRQNACIFIQNFPESGCLNYGAYRADPFLLLKTQWKKWKTSRKTRPFLHKSG